MIAPLIRPIRLQGGTFYTFSSASEDLGLSFNSSDKKFRFSKFALLNIPNIENPTSNFENFVGLSNSPGAYEEIDGSKTQNDYLAESFQNYCLNLEAMVTSSASYDQNLFRTPSERVFYKWLKELGAIRFREAVVGTEQTNSTYGIHFVEEDNSATYERVIKYVGDIGILNTVKNNANAFTEVYVYIPTGQGNTPTVLFKCIDDANYAPGMLFTNDPADPLDAEYIYGRTPATVQPAGLSTKAFFDSDTFTFTTPDPFGATADFYYYDTITATYVQQGNAGFQWWYANPVPNTYFTEPTSFIDPTNDTFKIESVNKSTEFKRSRLDGVTVEFDTAVYTGMANAGIDNFGKFNETAAAQSFDFNAVLIYYDLYDPATLASSTSNLFGILFLDNVDPLPSGGGYIPRLTKYKPNSVTGANGNSYSFRINLKFDVNTDDTAVETSINDYNPYSLELYMDVLNEMTASVILMNKNNQLITNLQTQVNSLSNLILDSTSAATLSARITELDTLIANNQAIFASNASLLNLIQKNHQDIVNIYNNTTSIDVAYNLDVITQGQGIFLDKSQAGQVKIVNTSQEFNLGAAPLVSIANDFTVLPNTYQYTDKLIPFSNYLKITDGSVGSPYVTDRDIVIRINDTDIKWEKGQSYRISFKYGVDMSNNNGNFNLVVYTDATDKLNTGFAYGAEAAYITYLEFNEKGDKPTIEIICLDPDTFTFTYDIF
jgi:hypothetical protein